MRPRVFPAEDSEEKADRVDLKQCFNEPRVFPAEAFLDMHYINSELMLQ